ncbi:hypothetical protein MRX96_037251 [Rhipicephalus microplus]
MQQVIRCALAGLEFQWLLPEQQKDTAGGIPFYVMHDLSPFPSPLGQSFGRGLKSGVLLISLRRRKAGRSDAPGELNDSFRCDSQGPPHLQRHDGPKSELHRSARQRDWLSPRRQLIIPSTTAQRYGPFFATHYFRARLMPFTASPHDSISRSSRSIVHALLHRALVRQRLRRGASSLDAGKECAATPSASGTRGCGEQRGRHAFHGGAFVCDRQRDEQRTTRRSRWRLGGRTRRYMVAPSSVECASRRVADEESTRLGFTRTALADGAIVLSFFRECDELKATKVQA